MFQTGNFAEVSLHRAPPAAAALLIWPFSESGFDEARIEQNSGEYPLTQIVYKIYFNIFLGFLFATLLDSETGI